MEREMGIGSSLLAKCYDCIDGGCVTARFIA